MMERHAIESFLYYEHFTLPDLLFHFDHLIINWRARTGIGTVGEAKKGKIIFQNTLEGIENSFRAP